jgi:hypothetical protein
MVFFFATVGEFLEPFVKLLVFNAARVFFARDAKRMVARVFAASPASSYAAKKDERHSECR